ncbi:hypothetical protein JCM5353_008649, partial [Sporobolomyces roseus]
MVDSKTRYIWVETVMNKGGIAEVVKKRLQREERSEGISVISFQSDNGTEFVNSTLDSFLDSKGIQHRKTVPYVHGQNGLVERRFRQLLETTRALLASSQMPLSFWPFAFHSAVYLYNINVSVALSNKSPFEMYYGKKPQI